MLNILGSAISWLMQPNNIVAPTLITVGGWLYAKLRGQKTASFQTTITGAIGSLLQEALDAWRPNGGNTLADGLAYVRGYAEREVWAVMTKRKVPRNSITEALVHAAIEAGTNELGSLIGNKLAAVQMPAALDDLAAKVAAVKDAFKVDPASPMATLGREIGAMVERVDQLPSSPSPAPGVTP